VNNYYRSLLLCMVLTVPVCMLGSAQSAEAVVTETVPQEIVDCYAAQYQQYPKRFIEAGCLNIIRGHSADYLAKQSEVDAVCFSQKKKCKSDAFVNIGKCCQRLEGLYLKHPFFTKRYTASQFKLALQDWLEDEQVKVTAARLLDACEVDSRAITVHYDEQSFTTRPGSLILLWLYRSCENVRFRDVIAEAVKNPVNIEHVRKALQKHQKSPEWLNLAVKIKGNNHGRLDPMLYSMAVEVAAQQVGCPCIEWRGKDVEMGIRKTDEFYTLLVDSVKFERCRDARFKEFFEEYLSKLVSRRAFVQSTCTLGSIGRDATCKFLDYYLNAHYAQCLVQKFDTAVCAPLGHEYARRAQGLLNCFSQDARVTLLLCQRDREMAQLQTAKQKEFLGVMRGLLLDTAYNLKQTACTQEEQGMLAQRAKLQADSQEWIAAAEQLEKSRAGFELGVQSGIDMLQLAKQGVRDVGAVGVEYLAQKNNGSVQKSRMQTWIEFVAGKKQQRAAADTLAQKNALVVLNPYLTRFMQVIPHRKELRQKFEIDSAAWKAAQQKLETERTVYEQRLNDGAALVEQTNSAACECAAEKLHSVADLLAQSNRGLQQQQEQNLLRAMLVGCYQVIKKNSQSKVSYETIRNSSSEHASPTTDSVVQGSPVMEMDLNVLTAPPTQVPQSQTRQNNPYEGLIMGAPVVGPSVGVMGTRRVVSGAMPSQVVSPSYGQTFGLPPAYDGAHYFTNRSSVGAQNAVVRHVAPNGMYVYRQ